MEFNHTRTQSNTQKSSRLICTRRYLNRDSKKPILITISKADIHPKNGSIVFESRNSLLSPTKLIPNLKKPGTILQGQIAIAAANRLRHSRSGIPTSTKLPKKETQLPASSLAAIKIFNRELTDIETQEIMEYRTIYYLGLHNEPIKLDGKNNGYDDNKGFYKLYVGDHLGFRYEILSLLGKGTFGYVCKCYDHKRKEEVAAKIIKNKKEYHNQALVEINLLEELRAQDPDNSSHIVRVKRYMLFRNHVIILFELLEMSLFHYLRVHRSIPIELISSFAAQILIALKQMSKSKIIHCDMKPDNILFKNNKSNSLKVIDFGLGCFANEKVHTYIQSRFYRAPEIVLGIPYTGAIDMWSFGCVLAELVTGSPLFPCSSEEELIQTIVNLIGPPSKNVIFNAKKKSFFDSIRDVQGRLEEYLACGNERLVDLIKKCLDWDPSTRITPSQALKHPFILTDLKSPKTRYGSLRRSIS